MAPGYHPWRKRLLLLTILAGSSSLWLGCQRTDDRLREPVFIGGVIDHASGGSGGVSFDADRTRQVLEEALAETGALKLLDKDEPGAFQAELVLTLARERESRRTEETGLYRAMQVDLSLSRWGADNEREKLLSQGKAFQVQDPDRLDRQEGFEQVLEQAIRQAVQYAALQVESRSFPLAKLEAMLSSHEAEDRLYVLRALRDRPEPELLPRIIEMLSDQDPEVAMEAIGVLVAQKDQRAVTPLIRAAQGRDQVFLLQNITALGEIGGPVARGYLFTLASGHTSPVIRERAAEALRQLERQTPEEPRAVAIPESVPTKKQPGELP